MVIRHARRVADGENEQVIRPSRILAYGAALVIVLVTWLGSWYSVFDWSGYLGPVICSVLAAAGLEALWRYDFRPQLRWNKGGVVFVNGNQIRRLAWPEVASIEVRSNTIYLHTSYGLLRMQYDRPYWLALVSTYYRDLPGSVQERLNIAWSRRFDLGEERPPEIPSLKRPIILYLALAASLAGAAASYF